jgi:parallel beta-helix repeat protein
LTIDPKLQSRSSFIAILFICCSLNAATTYYVDAEKGDDSNSGTETTTAWKTIAKVTAEQKLLKAGDSVLFHSGQIFFGQLTVTVSGKEDAPITYGRYGDGEKPEITGFTEASNWMPLRKGIWEAECPAVVCKPNVLTIGGRSYALGRFPNADAPNGGYLTVKSHVGNKSITCPELAAAPDWTGAEVVIRKFRWVIDRNLITAHTEHTLQYKSASSYEGIDRHGFFIQNDPRTLDAYGEWYFDVQSKKAQVFFGDAGPGEAKVRVAALSRLIVAATRQDLCFDGLKMTGANEIALCIDNSSRITIRNCEIRWSGTYAIRGPGVKAITLEDSTIQDTNSNAIAFHDGVSNTVIRRVNISDTATFPGMGLSGDGTYNAITMLNGNDNLIEDFKIVNTGYIPVHFHGSRITVRNGFIDHFAMVKDDSGGIYTWTGATDRTPYTDRKITGNIILHSKGALAGAYGEAKGFGIYLDDACANVEVSGNSVALCSAGIFLHNAHHCQITKNTFFDNDAQMLIAHDDIDPAAHAEIREVTSTENTFVARTHEQWLLNAASTTDDFAQFGKLERNIYARPSDQGLVVLTAVKNARPQAYDIEGFQTVTKLESGTQPSAVRLAPYKIENLGPNLTPNGTFSENVGQSSCWSLPGNSVITWEKEKLDGGTLHHAYKTPSGKPNPTLLQVQAGPLKAGKNYVARFSVLGGTNNGSAAVHLRQYNKPWADLTDYQFVKLDQQRRECELVFAALSDEEAVSLEWAFNERDGTFWLDNVAFHEAVVAQPDPRIFRFEYNAGTGVKSATLDGEWVDVLGTTYSKKIDLPARSSLVLIQKGACLQTPAK